MTPIRLRYHFELFEVPILHEQKESTCVLTTPFGGCRTQAIGREGGDYALDFHSDLKTLQISEGSVR